MKRRVLLQRAASLTAAAVAAPVLGQQAALARVRPAGHKPNILLIVTDQQRAHRDLPSAVPLPGHERLLQGAASLGNFHVNTTPCSPSRSVLFTGQHTQHTLITANLGLPPFRELSPQVPTLGHMLREQGYPVAQGFLFARPLAPQDLERWLVARMAPAQDSADQPVHGEESA